LGIIINNRGTSVPLYLKLKSMEEDELTEQDFWEIENDVEINNNN